MASVRPISGTTKKNGRLMRGIRAKMMAATITEIHGRARARSRTGLRDSTVTCTVPLFRDSYDERK